MKIFHLSNSDIRGGAARAAKRLHQALLETGLKSQMLVNKKFSKDKTIFGPLNFSEKLFIQLRPRISNLLIKLFNTHNDITHSISIFQSPWIDYINKSDVDIVHLHWVQNEMLSIADIGRIKKPIVWTLHDMWAFCGAEHLSQNNRWRFGYTKTNRPLNESGLDINRWTWTRKLNHWKKPIYIVAPSNWLANCVRQSKLMRNWPLSVVANLIDTNSWKPKDKKEEKKKFGISPDTPLIIFGTYGANNNHNKGFDLFLETLDYLKKDVNLKKMEIIVYGKHKNNIPKTKFPIHYLGHLNDNNSLMNLYSAADATVVPSRQESFCQTASESHACGTPVVGFNIGGLNDIVDHLRTGYLAKAFDTQDLAKGISWVINESKKETLQNQARLQAVEKFSQKVLVQEYQKIYSKVLSNKNK